jgi:hypothetical protein
MTDHKPELRPWWLRGLLTAATGYVFSLLLSAFLVVLAIFQFGPALSIERQGIDLAFRLYTVFPVLFGNTDPRQTRHGYVFLDIDRAACYALSGPQAESCDTQQPVPVAVLAPVVKAVRMSCVVGASPAVKADRCRPPAVVIVDVAPPKSADERSLLRSALTGAFGPWIVAPTESRPGPSVTSVRLDIGKQIIPGLKADRVRLAPVSTFEDPTADDGLIRHFPIVFEMSQAGESRTHFLPAAPFLAALIAEAADNPAAQSNIATVDCRFYNANDRACDKGLNRVIVGRKAYALAGPNDLQHLEEIGLLNRIFFSLPTLAGSDDSTSTADAFRGLYERYRVSQMLGPDDQVHIPHHLLDGKIVVIGSSAVSVNDWHATPLGAMPGAEIILNAVRAYAEFAPVEQISSEAPLGVRLHDAWRSFLEKAWAASLVAVFLAFAWMAIAYLTGWGAALLGIRRLLVQLLCGAIFAVGIGLGLWTEIVVHAQALREGARAGRAVDFLTPLFALGLEGYADAAKVILANLEFGLTALSVALASYASRLVRPRHARTAGTGDSHENS